MKIALIDLGSNSARMTLAEKAADGGFLALCHRRQMVRLSEGMAETSLLQEAPMARTIEVLKTFAKEAVSADAPILAVATAAVRRAANGTDFCRRLEEETGIRLQVISGRQEAILDFHGVLASLPDEGDCLMVDMGGGSCELILAKDQKMEGKISLPFGAMTLTDRFFRSVDPMEGDRLSKAAVSPLLEEISFLSEAAGLPLIVLGGSGSVLPAVDARLSGTDLPGTPHGYQITGERLFEIAAALRDRTLEERMTDFGLEKGRADTICAGLVPYLLLTERLRAPYLRVSVAGLRDGILALLTQKGITDGFDRPDLLSQLFSA